MSTGGASSFLPTSDVEDILATLRKLGIPWLADEIELMIQQGRDVEMTRAPADRRKGRLPAKYTDVVPFTENEQEAILLTALHQYFVVLPQCLEKAEESLANSVSKSVTGHLSVAITRPGTDTPMPTFTPKFAEIRDDLAATLRKAWPLNEPPFVLKF